MVLVKKGGKLPKEVSMAAGTMGMKLTEIAEYRVGDEYVTIINHRGQKYSLELVKLMPAEVTPATAPVKAKRRSSRGAKRQKSAPEVSNAGK